MEIYNFWFLIYNFSVRLVKMCLLLFLGVVLGGCINRESIEKRVRQLCNGDNVARVEVCGDYVKVVSNLLGGGSTYYRENGSEIKCPVVGPDSMSQECKDLLFKLKCQVKDLCD